MNQFCAEYFLELNLAVSIAAHYCMCYCTKIPAHIVTQLFHTDLQLCVFLYAEKTINLSKHRIDGSVTRTKCYPLMSIK